MALPNVDSKNMGETSKSRPRRIREGFFDKYCRGRGLDIGYGGDPILPTVDLWDHAQGNAQFLLGVPENTYDFVYSSHCLEHMWNCYVALMNWFRVVKVGGYLIFAVPDRDLYEKRRTLPSRWNSDHKAFFLLGQHEYPHTIGAIPMIHGALYGLQYKLVYAKVCAEGCIIADPDIHSVGEYQIEAVIQKV
jgi:SAM-dependent methyltransferase